MCVPVASFRWSGAVIRWNPDVTGSQLARTGAAPCAHAFTRANAISTDEAPRKVEEWLDVARGIPLLGPDALAGGGRALSSDACIEVAAAFVLSSGECRQWLTECVGVVAGRPGFSKLDTAARDAELARREAEIRSIETELERRRISARRDEADAALAALVGGEAA